MQNKKINPNKTNDPQKIDQYNNSKENQQDRGDTQSSQTNNDAQQGNRNAKESPITLPKGGGAIQGMGEKFQANPVTGTGSLTVPLNMSPGRNGFTPQLALSYDSGSGNGTFGLGWSIGLPQITRKTQRELPRYKDINLYPSPANTDGTTEDTFILSGAEDLVPVLIPDGDDLIRKVEQITEETDDYIVTYYRPRTEGLFASIERWYNTSNKITHWRSTSKDNITSIYGLNETARIADPSKQTKIFKWLLERTYDAKGNVIYYEYKKEDTENIVKSVFEKNRLKNLNAFENVYPKTIHYGNKIPLNAINDFSAVNTAGWFFKLVFDYGEYTNDNDGIPTLPQNAAWHVRQDPFSVYSPGFEIRTYRLCRRILMYHDFTHESVTDYSGIVKSTEFSYDENPIATMLTSVKYRFYDVNATGTDKTADMPPLDFTYSKAEIDASLHYVETEDLKNIPEGINGDSVRFADIYATGIPGLLIEDKNAWYYKENLGDIDYYGTSIQNTEQKGKPHLKLNPIKRLAQKPALAGVSSQSMPFSGSLTDIDGDGIPELMIFVPPYTGYFKQEENSSGLNDPKWKYYIPFSQVPNINMNDPNMRTLDITGDGNPDLLITEQDCFVCYPSAEDKGWEKAFRVSKALEEEKGPAVVFNDPEQSIYLADMSGSGMTDIVRIRNGSVDYWTNIGYGRFSQKVSMGNAPRFDFPDKFNQNRIRIADIDGSGTADILYLGDKKLYCWLNQSGNSFSNAFEIKNFPKTDNLANVFVTDFLGNGTSCIVWSSGLPGDKPHHIKFMDLMSGIKPYLLLETNNNCGGLSRYRYVPSTKFYLKHKAEGKPWKTKLPFPVQVLERTETFDLVTGNRFVSLYEYRDGYYDGYEREFRGFGTVEQRDTERYASFSEGDLFTPGSNTDVESHIPPIRTVTTFHTGAVEFPSFEGSENRSMQEKREAYRAMRGRLLKQEIYAEDESENEGIPYQTIQKKYEVKQLQGLHKNKHAVFFVIDSETRTFQSERNPDDTRIMQALTLESDEFGNPLKTVQIAYPRGFLCENPASNTEPEQQQMLITFNLNAYINETENFRLIGLPLTTEAYEMTGLDVPEDFFTIDELSDAYANAQSISFEETPDTQYLQKRLLTRTHILYHSETPSAGTPLLPGTAASHGLPFQSYTAVYTEDLLADVYGTPISQYPILKTGETIVDVAEDLKYIQGSDIYTGSDLFDDDLFYKPSEKLLFDPDAFFLPTETHDIFGNNPTVLTYDDYSLLPVSIEDALGNTITALNDYRVLQTKQITDINENRSTAVFDTRGAVIKTILQGKTNESKGDTEANPTVSMEYELFNYMNNEAPNYVKTVQRVRHVNDDLSDVPLLTGTPAYTEAYAYTGGLGQQVMVKVQAEDGYIGENLVEDRWVGTGRTVYNNKGKVVKQYEPYFSDTYAYESEEDMPAYGVTPIMHYDPLGRPIRTDLPDGTFTKVEFSPWEVKHYDTDDTVLKSNWLKGVFPTWDGIPANLPSITGKTGTERAALLTVRHANTPQTVAFDVLGRAFLTLDHNGFDANEDPILYAVRNTLDVMGNIVNTRDAKGRNMTQHVYDIAGRPMKTVNIDSGTRLMMADAADRPFRQADSRGHILSFEYDELQRPTKTTLTLSSTDKTILKTEYGTVVQTANNLNGKPYKSYDQSGITTIDGYDFKDNSLQSTKQFCTDYENTIDWNSTVNLETTSFTNSAVYDALNRPVKQTEPDGSIVLNRFNKAGLLEKIELKHRGQGDFVEYVSNIEYNEKAQRTKIEYGNSTVTTYTYNPKNFRLTKIKTLRSNTVLQEISYIYDPEGNITEIYDAAQQTLYFDNTEVEPRNLYEYDALYRLLKAQGREHISNGMPSNTDFVNNIPLPNDATALKNYTQTYQYDELGNLLQMKNNGVWTRDYFYDFNTNNYLLKHTENGQNEYLYDVHGNITKLPHLQELIWDHADQLKEVTLDTSGNTSYYVYDTNGDRVRKVVVKNNGTIVEGRFYIGDYEIYTKKTNGTLDTERETLHLVDDKSKVALIDYDTQTSTATVRYQYTNHLDSSSLELDETGDIISYEEYHPFGTSSYRSGRSETEVSLKRYKYVFKELDNETGLYYYGMRYYAPWVARFISVDPLQFKYPIYTPYQYAGNMPVSFTDLDGAEPRYKPRTNTRNNRRITNAYEEIRNQQRYAVNRAKQRSEGNKPTDFEKIEIINLKIDYIHETDEGSVISPLTNNQLGELLIKVIDAYDTFSETINNLSGSTNSSRYELVEKWDSGKDNTRINNNFKPHYIEISKSMQSSKYFYSVFKLVLGAKSIEHVKTFSFTDLDKQYGQQEDDFYRFAIGSEEYSKMQMLEYLYEKDLNEEISKIYSDEYINSLSPLKKSILTQKIAEETIGPSPYNIFNDLVEIVMKRGAFVKGESRKVEQPSFNSN